MRSMVEGARGAEAGREAEAPSTALGAVPLPRFAGQDKNAKDCQPSARIVGLEKQRKVD
jgi:hypothetical protein